MKNYIEKQTLFYTLVCSEILSESESVILERIAPLFTCTEKEKAGIRFILERDDFRNASSILGITMRQNFSNSFGKGLDTFGSAPTEATALEIKKSAYNLLSELKKDLRATVDLRGAVAQLAETSSQMGVLFAVLLYCRNADRKVIFSSLKKAARDDLIDAKILLLFFAESVEQRKALASDLAKCSASPVCQDIIGRITSFYELTA